MNCIQFNNFAQWQRNVNTKYVYASSIYSQTNGSIDCALNLSKDSPYLREKRIFGNADIEYVEWVPEFKNGEVIRREYTYEPEETDVPLDLSKKSVESKSTGVKKRRKPRRTVDKPHGLPVYKRRIIRCHLCPFTTDHKNNLRKHVTGKHLEADNVECPKCGKVSKHRYSLAVHLNYCGKEPRFHCAYCPSKYPKKDHLQRHVQRKHVGKPMVEGATPYASECSSPTPSVDENTAPSSIEMMKMIEKQAIGDAKAIECPRCGRGFNYYGHMQRHYKSCSGNSIQCKLCPYKAKDSEMLRIHVSNLHQTIDFEQLAVLGITLKTGLV